MNPKHASNELQKLQSQLRFQRVMNIGLVAAINLGILLLGFTVFRETTHILPPEIRRPYEIGADYANKDYLLDMANYVLSMVLTVTPESVEHNNKVILKMTQPEGYANLKAALDAAALRVKQERVTTVWVPHHEEIYEKEKRIKVNGKFKTFIADKLTSERDKTYLVDFTITNSGRLYVSKIEEFVKDDSAKPNN
jgi:conjugal transfer pilus assembly protein TraE